MREGGGGRLGRDWQGCHEEKLGEKRWGGGIESDGAELDKKNPRFYVDGAFLSTFISTSSSPTARHRL